MFCIVEVNNFHPCLSNKKYRASRLFTLSDSLYIVYLFFFTAFKIYESKIWAVDVSELKPPEKEDFIQTSVITIKLILASTIAKKFISVNVFRNRFVHNSYVIDLIYYIFCGKLKDGADISRLDF